MKNKSKNRQCGFTLIEVIITLVVLAILAAMVASYFGTSIFQSSTPVSRLKAAGKLNAVMEKITADYNNSPATWSPNTAYAVDTVILPTIWGKNWYQYICTVTGTSGSTEPAWPRPKASCTTGSNLCTVDDENCTLCAVTDGSVTWTYSGPQTPLKNWLENTAYTKNAIVYSDNGYQYICTVAGISGSTEPIWPTTINAKVTETTGSTPKVQWQCKGLQPLLTLQNSIGNEESEYSNKTFGGDNQVKYRVIYNRFITYVNNQERNTAVVAGEADYGKYLKVTIGLHSTESPRTGETLTTLFVRR